MHISNHGIPEAAQVWYCVFVATCCTLSLASLLSSFHPIKKNYFHIYIRDGIINSIKPTKGMWEINHIISIVWCFLSRCECPSRTSNNMIWSTVTRIALSPARFSKSNSQGIVRAFANSLNSAGSINFTVHHHGSSAAWKSKQRGIEQCKQTSHAGIHAGSDIWGGCLGQLFRTNSTSALVSSVIQFILPCLEIRIDEAVPISKTTSWMLSSTGYLFWSLVFGAGRSDSFQEQWE